MKTCSECGVEKEKEEFSKSKLAVVCKACYPEFKKKRNREYQTKNRERLKPYIKAYQQKNAEKISAQKREYRKKIKERLQSGGILK